MFSEPIGNLVRSAWLEVDIFNRTGLPMLSQTSFSDALHGMFDLSPTAFCISTTAGNQSRYVRVNQAYLDLIGRAWDEIEGEPLSVITGSVEEDRMRRLRLLETVGSFSGEEVQILHASGRKIPTLVSCQRRVVDGLAIETSIIVDISARKDFENRILKAAFTDAMTGLPNRAAFDHELATRISDRSDGGAIGLAYVDLNGFKAVNDAYGHAVGDSLLKIIAQRLGTRTKTEDFVARLGGDEFGIIFTFAPDRQEEAVSRFHLLAEEICGRVKIDKLDLHVGAAVGVATATGLTTPHRLMVAADKLMYRAKATNQRVSVRSAA